MLDWATVLLVVEFHRHSSALRLISCLTRLLESRPERAWLEFKQNLSGLGYSVVFDRGRLTVADAS